MTFVRAIEARQWEVVALRLLLGVSEAARSLPPGGTIEILALLDGDQHGPTR